MAAYSTKSLNGRDISYYGELIKELGTGGFGTVYLYRNAAGEEFAIKKTRQRDDDVLSLDSVLHEVVFPLNLDHPNIISYLDVYLPTIRRVTIVMPVAQSDLNGLIVSDYFVGRPDRIQQVTAQLVSALAYLTRHNIIHCDIKPLNVLCFRNDEVSELRSRSKSPLREDKSRPSGQRPDRGSEEDEVSELSSRSKSPLRRDHSRSKSPLGDEVEYTYKLSDFGLARDRTCMRENNDMGMYTLWYRPPEILTNKLYTELTDVWALGCVLYEVFFGVPLFRDADREFTMLFLIRSKINSEFRSVPWDGAPPGFQDLVCDMLTISPRDRKTIFALQDHYYFDGFDRAAHGISNV